MTNDPQDISKIIPYKSFKRSPDDSLRLPDGFDLQGTEEVFVWRDGAQIVLSANPPPATLCEIFDTVTKMQSLFRRPESHVRPMSGTKARHRGR